MSQAVGVSEEIPRPRKVCFISPLGYGLYNPASAYPFGGAEVQFFLLARQLAEDVKFEVSVLTTVREGNSSEAYGALRVFKRTGQGRLTVPPMMTLMTAAKLLVGFIKAFLSMARQFRQIGADVYLHAGAGVEVGAYALLCRLMRKRFTFVVASSADVSTPHGLVTGPLKWLFPLGVRLAHAVVCRTEDQQQWLQERYGRRGVLIRTAHPLPQRQDIHKSYVLWVGRGHPLKQPEVFIGLAARLREHPFMMVVAGEEGHSDLLKQLRTQVMTSHNIELRENVPWCEMSQLYEGARLLVNTSLYEGFPNTFVEAALSATPVISLSVDPDGILRKQLIGVCAEGNTDKLYELTSALLDDPPRMIRLGLSARSYALQHHGLENALHRLKDLIGTLTEQPHGAY
ncbi:MAG: glycosyltransferase family 4 protein [Nitrospira sp.]